MTHAFIVSAARTPVGKFLGGFQNAPAHLLGATAIKAALERAGIEPHDATEAVMGQVLTAAQGQNPARQAAIAAGMPVHTTAMNVNQMCGSGLRAVALASQAIRSGDSSILVAGGQENMSLAPHAAMMRSGQKMGELALVDTMLKDGLIDAFLGGHMGIHTETLAQRYQVTREEQEAFALTSQRRAGAAAAAGRFDDEIVAVTTSGRKGEVVITADEFPRPDVTAEQMSALRPVFSKDGTITAATASGLNDGAAALVLMSEQATVKSGAEPLARIVSWATAGVEPEMFGTGPIPAVRLALARAGWSIDDLDLVECNEAYAAQSLVVIRELGLDPDKVNVNGGAIAIGHPIGASGARVLVTLLYEMKRRNAQRGLATLCIGGGMCIAMCVEAA